MRINQISTAKRIRDAMRRAAALMALAGVLACMAGCGTTHPPRLAGRALVEAQTFPYFRLYWAGPTFAGHPLTAVDGRESYNSAIGSSIYYGDCGSGRSGLGGGGSCGLPLKVTTVIYRLHSNVALGPQRNALIRGVPATIYDKGRSIELYSGRLAIDLFSDTPAHALLAARQLHALNATGPASGPLPAPVYCPGLAGSVQPAVRSALQRLPGHPCQRARAALAAIGRSSEAP